MKKIIILALAAAIFAAGCTKEQKPTETKNVKVTAYAEISGALTQGLKISYEITTFDGKKESGVLNENFAGKNCQFTFDMSSRKVGDSMTASFHAERIESKLDGVMGPWAMKCGVRASIPDTGVEDKWDVTENETHDTIGLEDGYPAWLTQITNTINTAFGDTWTVKVTVDKEGFTLETIKPEK